MVVRNKSAKNTEESCRMFEMHTIKNMINGNRHSCCYFVARSIKI